jgi:ribosomal protein S18 acetylase RimI-like enzyme
MILMRSAIANDERALAKIDRATWSHLNSPVPLWSEDANFFSDGVPEDVIVAIENEEILGYVKLRTNIGLTSNGHVIMIGGLAVRPESQRNGIGAALVRSAIDEAGARGARRLTLHVLGTNLSAKSLYETCGFVVEGVLREEFLLEGSFVDDVILARNLTATEVPS